MCKPSCQLSHPRCQRVFLYFGFSTRDQICQMQPIVALLPARMNLPPFYAFTRLRRRRRLMTIHWNSHDAESSLRRFLFPFSFASYSVYFFVFFGFVSLLFGTVVEWRTRGEFLVSPLCIFPGVPTRYRGQAKLSSRR